jgi:hypothetical protein
MRNTSAGAAAATATKHSGDYNQEKSNDIFQKVP